MRQLSLYQLQYRFMEGLIGGLQCILSQSVWTSRKPGQLYNANRNPICRPVLSLCTRLSPPRIFPPLSKDLFVLSVFNLAVFVCSLLPSLLSGAFRRLTFYVSLFHGFFKDCL